ncbi:DNA topoisomerase I, mitochondrial [Halyomorpha halys]|uniref:DNA topoisomerase I, mitochondrial n=1 Tax=Halyomorpha halys TaxID=286706 RepID=UPI0006D4FCFB
MDSEYLENSINGSINDSGGNTTYNHSEGSPTVNGISNGLSEKHKKKEHRDDKHRDRHKDKHRDKDRDRDREKHRDKDREKDKDREHKHSSSSSHKDKSKDSHSTSRDKDKEKHREKDKDRHRDEKRDKEHRSSSSHKDKDKHSSTNSSSSKDKDKSHSSSKDKDKEKNSSKDKDRSDRDKHRDREKDKDRSKHNGDRKHSSSSSSSREKEKKDKERSKEAKPKRDEFEEADDFQPSKVSEEEPVVVKSEPVDIKEEPIDDSYLSEDQNSCYNNLTIKEEEDEAEEPQQEDSEDDAPLLSRTSNIKREIKSEDEEEDIPLSARKKVKKEKTGKRKKESDDEEEDDDFKPVKKKSSTVKKTKVKTEAPEETSPKKKKKQEEEQEVWKWWEEEKRPDGVKWTFLEHKGPVFAPPYEPLPPDVKFFYDGKEMKLSEEAEEVATFYGRMIDHEYTTKEAFNKNFFKDWRKVMTQKEKDVITDLKKCNFRQINTYFLRKSEERKAMSKEEKKVIKEKNEELVKEYGFCIIDGHKEKIGNFKIEPPSLFRGRGEHPKMGMLKRRVQPEDVLINCSKDSKIPKPPEGHKWKEVRHDNTVTWLASWTENVQGQVKYVMLNPSSKLKGEKDWQKYETARKLAHSIDKIRKDYREDWKSKEMRIRQRAVAMYFIDILALRAGNEKDEDQADTVGCCSLRVEHITLHNEKDGKEYVVVFDFLGKDSIRYYNEVPIEKRVFKNLQLFMEGKKGSDDLFDRLNTSILNKHLNELMEGLTAKVFRTYNASWTLQQQLKELTDPNYTVPEMVLAYNRANRAVAILCNHQRSVPKTHQNSMEKLKEKIAAKKDQIEEAEKQYKYAKKDAKNGSAKERIVADKKKKALDRLREQLTKLEVQETDREENKTIALSTSKLNYLDPRISVAWCKKYNVPIEKIYNKTQRDKFRWAIDMAGPDYVF